jgi:hypothetical protein
MLYQIPRREEKVPVEGGILGGLKEVLYDDDPRKRGREQILIIPSKSDGV